MASKIIQDLDATTLGRQGLCDMHGHLQQVTLTSDLGEATPALFCVQGTWASGCQSGPVLGRPTA